jgi:hypothetical protein
MLPIAALSEKEATSLRGLLFDLDDTLLDHGTLTEAAYGALFRLRDAGFDLCAVTGRPAGWGEVVLRQWPISAAITENGGITLYRSQQRVVRLNRSDAREQRTKARRLSEIVATLRAEFDELEPADDVWLRLTDYTFDIGEHEHLPRAFVDDVSERARALGAKTIRSSVHLHISLDAHDKASAAVELLCMLTGLDATRVRSAYAFIGDSENDHSCFAAFQTSIGVRNLSGRLTLPPRFITAGERGAGFVEAASVLTALPARRNLG